MEQESRTMNTKELSQAVHALLEREEERSVHQRRRQRRRTRRRRAETEARIAKLANSVEVIKWCIVSITAVIVLSLLVVIMVIMEVEREAERIKGEVESIRGEAMLIRDKLRHPLQTLGGAVGGQLDRQLTEALGIGDEQ